MKPAQIPNDKIKISLLGASFETGNLGVNALAEASVKVILSHWPDAEIAFFGSGFSPKQERLNIAGRDISVRTVPVRFSKNVLLPYHFLRFVLYGVLGKILPGSRAKDRLLRHNTYVRTLYETDLALDITGGDSFSDIYGSKRFYTGTLRKWLVVLFGKKLVMMPQTYGPFDKRLTMILARRMINYATLVYSRDQAGVKRVKELLGEEKAGEKVSFVPDVGFILDPRRPNHEEIDSLEKIKSANNTLVGLNISGLLSHGEDTGDNVFDLKTDYPALIDSIIAFLMKQDGTAVLLVPHVIALHKSDAPAPQSARRKGYGEQSDAAVCEKLYERVAAKHPGRIFIVRGSHDHGQIKYIIGLCDFFIGSRMHACIAALSQCVPAVGIAYSGKFQGVFESVGVGDCVADARRCREDELLEKVSSAYQRRDQIRENLHETVPRAKRAILDMFKALEL